MHESIATAIYKGHKRTLDDRLNQYVQRLPAGGPPRRRKPWLRAVRTAFRDLPSDIWFGEFAGGSGKDAVVDLLGVRLGADAGRSMWFGSTVQISARRFSVESHGLPIRISNHAITRAMQRLALPDVRAAASQLSPAFFYALLVERYPPRDGSSVLLPTVGGGAVVAIADRDDPEDWVFLTYIDAGKLRPEQLAELAVRREKFAARLVEIGMKAELVPSL